MKAINTFKFLKSHNSCSFESMTKVTPLKRGDKKAWTLSRCISSSSCRVIFSRGFFWYLWSLLVFFQWRLHVSFSFSIQVGLFSYTSKLELLFFCFRKWGWNLSMFSECYNPWRMKSPSVPSLSNLLATTSTFLSLQCCE